MNKRWVKFPEVLFFQEGPGVRNTQYTSEGVKLLNVANLVNGKVDISNSDRFISRDEAYGKYKHFLCDNGDFIVASSGIKVEYIDKKMGFIDKSMLPLCMNTSTIRFKVLNSKELNIRYFMYYLKSRHFKLQLAKQITGSAQLNYGPSHLKDMCIPIVDIYIQNNIVEILDKIQNIIDTYEVKIEKLDILVKARFVEMFGDIQSEEKYKNIKLKEICNTVSGGTPSTRISEYYNGEIPWITTVSLGDNYINGVGAKAYITKSAIDNSATKLIPAGNILFGTRVGVGKSSINMVDLCTNQDIVAIIDIDTNKFDRLFIKHVLDMNQPYYDSLKKGATILGITSEDLKDSIIPNVPIEVQNKFSEFVIGIDKSKVVSQHTTSNPYIQNLNFAVK